MLASACLFAACSEDLPDTYRTMRDFYFHSRKFRRRRPIGFSSIILFTTPLWCCFSWLRSFEDLHNERTRTEVRDLFHSLVDTTATVTDPTLNCISKHTKESSSEGVARGDTLCHPGWILDFAKS